MEERRIMTVMPKKKLCWNCEGSVSVAEETCPYCGVSVIPASLDGTTHGLNPPYQMNQMSGVKENVVPRSPFAVTQEAQDEKEEGDVAKEADKEELEDSEVPVDDFKNILLSLILLLAGSMFFLFSLTLALFSQGGIFTLQWNSGYWYIYSLLSLPLLFFGWRALLKLDEDK